MIIRQAPPGSAVRRAVQTSDSLWGLQEHLLAGMFDLLATANWQRGGDEFAKRPARLPRPGITDTAASEGETLARGKPVSIEEMNARLGWGAPTT